MRKKHFVACKGAYGRCGIACSRPMTEDEASSICGRRKRLDINNLPEIDCDSCICYGVCGLKSLCGGLKPCSYKIEKPKSGEELLTKTVKGLNELRRKGGLTCETFDQTCFFAASIISDAIKEAKKVQGAEELL